jgi:hypothetical protein
MWSVRGQEKKEGRGRTGRRRRKEEKRRGKNRGGERREERGQVRSFTLSKTSPSLAVLSKKKNFGSTLLSMG